MQKPRLGHIKFLNVLPLTYGLYNLHHGDSLAITNGVPAVINNDLLSNRLDVSEVSSIVYAKNYKDLLILPDICVRADGPVRSILLASKKPIEEINEDKIILTAQSATSHCMLKIIMKQAYDASPKYYIRNLSINTPVPDDATAALRIGDDALSLYHNRQKGYYYYDLGIEWKKLTGRCMVYALWTIHKDIAQNTPETMQQVYNTLYTALQDGIRHKNMALESLAEDFPLSPQYIREYLNIIKWNLTEEYLDNLEVFFSLAFKQGLIPQKPKLNMAPVHL